SAPLALGKGGEACLYALQLFFGGRFLPGFQIGDMGRKIGPTSRLGHFVQGDHAIGVLGHVLVFDDILQVVQPFLDVAVGPGVLGQLGQGAVVMGTRNLVVSPVKMVVGKA